MDETGSRGTFVQRRRRAQKSSGSRLGAPRAQAANRFARSSGDGLRRGERKFGLRGELDRVLRLLRHLAIFAHPARQEGLRGFFNPLLDQCGDFLADVGGMIQTRKLEAFQRGIRCFVQVVPWWSDPVTGHSNTPVEYQFLGEY